MFPVAAIDQAADHATNSILWVGLVAFVSLAASVAGILKAFWKPREYATLRQHEELAKRLDHQDAELGKRMDKHISEQREDYAAINAKLDGIAKDITYLRVQLAKRR